VLPGGIGAGLLVTIWGGGRVCGGVNLLECCEVGVWGGGGVVGRGGAGVILQWQGVRKVTVCTEGGGEEGGGVLGFTKRIPHFASNRRERESVSMDDFVVEGRRPYA